jgi:hypothetical protein
MKMEKKGGEINVLLFGFVLVLTLKIGKNGFLFCVYGRKMRW